MELSVVIPSLGRPSLFDAVASCGGADEVIVVFDGDESYDRAPVLPEWVRVIVTEPSGNWGSAQRNAGMLAAQGRWVAFMDDDDTYLPGGIEAIRKAERWSIFRVAHTGTVVWDFRGVQPGNVSTLGIVVPNTYETPEWPDGPGADFLFADACVKALGDPVWEETIVAQCVRSHGGRFEHTFPRLVYRPKEEVGPPLARQLNGGSP